MRIKWLAVLALLGATVTPARGQYGPAARVGATSVSAAHTLDSIADLTRKTRDEQVTCLHNYWVEDDTLTLVHFKRGAPFVSDSMHVWPAPGVMDLCPARMPVLHSHVAKLPAVDTSGTIIIHTVNDSPSTEDILSTFHHGTWGLLLVVSDSGWKLIVYP